MTPDVPSVLGELAQLLIRSAAPGVPDGERAGALGLSSMLLAMAAEVWDGAAETLVQENRALARLLGGAACEDDLRLSILRTENARLRTLLIAAQIDAETTGDVTRQTAIWTELRVSTERRKLSVSLV
ncbi:hypothetical protein [Phenylobacterium sp.]|uniref:hypothetical protein n=1 Tax=Phenylobacterium sp. TaxID=1871053 RepID=UPI00286CB4B5|nr:hypothetical protein [Phenylobacterium sp.]